ncbi:cytochrome b [Rhodanobacter sp. BL-MT-08]
MAVIESRSRYTAAARYLHWTVFALVLLAYVFINVCDFFPKGSVLRTNIKAAHFTAGIAVLLLMLPRVMVRLRRGAPPIAPALPHAIDVFGKLTHLALYAFLVVQPILGIVTLQVGGKTVTLFGVTLLPSFVGTPNSALSHQLEDIHGTIGTIFYYVIGLHIAAALWHHFGRRDNTLKRIL